MTVAFSACQKIMVYVFLADGFEETEAVAPIDIMRRAGIDVKTVAITGGGKEVESAHSIKFLADLDENSVGDDFEMIMLPGGMPGTRNLEKSAVVQKAIDHAAQSGKLIAAICAAPSILGHKGLLNGRKAVCYPGYENDLEGARVMSAQVCEDGQILTGNGPGAAFEFGLLLVRRLGRESGEIKTGMMIK